MSAEICRQFRWHFPQTIRNF